jgi:hypothetical protein
MLWYALCFDRKEGKRMTVFETELLTEEEVAGFLRLSVRTLQAWRLCNRGPTWTRIHGVVRYPTADLRIFIAAGRGLRRPRVMA